ncbi:MAG: peptidase M23B [Candidatus Peregrinibacteria bacterium GW2011_GWE2_39_6]|nr:MAG: peptidase M23B [Candidatus Peregrinibacteria bacterium GW2011_GWF2_39_17]KKR26340.1 MAG: peptidase M23B [Candidatus Peregrinibacteria bacterium GW2011_GWE2_39_6]HCW32831.1 hypothetical protein [Candidatus Peregrinibacteria bacterium]
MFKIHRIFFAQKEAMASEMRKAVQVESPDRESKAILPASFLNQETLWRQPAIQEAREDGDWESFRAAAEETLNYFRVRYPTMQIKIDGRSIALMALPSHIASPDHPFLNYLSLTRTADHILAKAIISKLDYRKIRELNASEVKGYFEALKRAVDKGWITCEQILTAIIPRLEYANMLFYGENFIKNELKKRCHGFKSENRNDPYTRFYKEVNRLAFLKDNQGKHEEVFRQYCNVFATSVDMGKQCFMFAKETPILIPPESTLSENHPDALDIGFEKVEVKGVEEIGPPLYAVNSGIVIAVGRDWKGGDTSETYESGGVSPVGGNGLIVFNPIKKEYSYYVHLHQVEVQVGEVIEAGTLIGIGGNTGINARKKGHGKHVHYEVHKDQGCLNVTELHKRISQLQREDI